MKLFLMTFVFVQQKREWKFVFLVLSQDNQAKVQLIQGGLARPSDASHGK